MKIRNSKVVKDFSIFNDEENPIGVLRVEKDENEQNSVSISLAETMNFHTEEEFDAFVEFVKSNFKE